MKYNTIKNAVTTVNTTDGNVSLTGDQVTELLEVSEIAVATLTANSGTGNYDKLVIDCDFGVRLHSCEMRYYFDSTVSGTAVASGISFQYKNEEFQDYTSLPIYINPNYYNTNVSGILFAPRYIRFTHDLEQTEGFLTTLSGYMEGNVRGLELYNDDSYVDFGSDGTAEGENISVAIGDVADIRSVAIYNSGPNKSTAYVSLDPTYTDLDEVMAVSLSEEGPWVYPMSEELSIMQAGENDDYGANDNVQLDNDIIRLFSCTDAYDNKAIKNESGSYTTKVISNDNTTWNSIIVDRVLPLNGSLKVDSDDGVETIEIRSSNYKPKPYHIYRELYGSVNHLRYTDKWVETDQIKTTSIVNLVNTGWGLGDWKNYFIVIDCKTERFGGFAFANHTTIDDSEWWIFNTDSNIITKSKRIVHSGSTDTLVFDWKDIKFDYEGGIWVYFYAVSYNASDFVDATGYYLCYFDKDMNEKFKYFNSIDFVGAMDVSYTTKHLWYTMPNANQIQQLQFDGTVLYNYFENTEDLGGLCVLYDGSVWYANGKNLYNLKENGTADDTKTLTDVADNKFVVLVPDEDGSEALWGLENFYVSRILLYGENKGKKEFSVYVTQAIKLYPVNNGVWVWCADVDSPGDSYMRYVSKVNKRIDKEYKLDYNSVPGVLEHTYEDQLYASKMPLTIDQEWSDLEWGKVNTESFILSEDNYHQIKITFQVQTPYQKYGDGVDIDSIFHSDDDFNQPDGSPNILIWGEYRSDDRVYVENNQLVMTNDTSVGGTNAYINTKNKYVLTGNFDVQFDYIIGDGTNPGQVEKIYLYAYATDDGVWGQYAAVHLIIMVPPSSSYMYFYINDFYASYGLGVCNDKWTGKLRLIRNGDRIYGYVWDISTSSWKGSYNSGMDNLGDYFYLQIVTLKDGSDIYIDNFTVNDGTPYYYTESPKLKGVYTCKEIEVKDIYPNTSKSVYLKSHVSQGLNVEDHYDTTLRARWRTPVE